MTRSRIVILSAYTFENLRLLFLSGDSQHPMDWATTPVNWANIS